MNVLLGATALISAALRAFQHAPPSSGTEENQFACGATLSCAQPHTLDADLDAEALDDLCLA
jgi:hypothetical protein